MRPVVLEVDRTLIDRQDLIHHPMAEAVLDVRLAHLPQAPVRAILGRSLPVAMAQRVPAHDPETQRKIIAVEPFQAAGAACVARDRTELTQAMEQEAS